MSHTTRGDGDVVLIVDDDPDLRSLISLALTVEDVPAVAVGDGAAAIEWFATHGRPRAVVLDVQMPGVDGWATMAALRKMDPDVPIVMCTVKAKDEARAREAGLEFIAKPFDVGEFVRIVLSLLEPRKEHIR